jgi:hypothetical protein
MSAVKFEDLPEKVREQFKQMKEAGEQLKVRNVVPNMPPPKKEKPSFPPLVKQIVYHPPEMRGNEPGAQPTPLRIISNPAQIHTMSDAIEFSGFQPLYDFLVQHKEIYEGREEIVSFTNFVESIPKACGCVRGTLNERAKDMYGKLLPVLQAKYPEVLEQIKNITKLTKIIFKDGTLLLLEV